jgi:hypothetical protein
VIIRALRGDYRALVCGGAPSVATNKAGTFTTSVVASTAEGNFNAILLRGAPGSVGRNANAAATVVMSVLTDGWSCNAGVGF